MSSIQSYFDQRRTEKYHESAADRASRSTARATWFIGALTLVAIGVGVSQYIIFSRQLHVMEINASDSDTAIKRQMAIMRGQLDQMDIAQRPWLRLSGFAPVRLIVDNDGVSITCSERRTLSGPKGLHSGQSFPFYVDHRREACG